MNKRNLTRRQFIQVTAGGIAAAAVAACAPPRVSQQGAEAPASEPQPSGPITLVRYGAMERDHLPLFENQAKGFSEKNPNVTIREAGVPWAQYLTKIRVLIGSGETPDVMWFMMHRRWDPAIEAETYIGEGITIPGNDIFDWRAANTIPELIEISTVNGKLVGMPFEVWVCGPNWYTNATLIEQAGLPPLPQVPTWDDLDGWVQEAWSKAKPEEFAITPGNWDWSQMMIQSGGDQPEQLGMITNDGMTSIIANDHYAENLSYLIGFWKRNMLKKGDAGPAGIDGMLGEKSYMAQLCTYSATQMNTAKFEYGSFSAPTYKGQQNRVSGATGMNYWCPSAESKHTKEAIAFAYYCGGQEGLGVWAASGRMAPVSTYTVDDYVQFAKDNNQLGDREIGFRAAMTTNLEVFPYLRVYPKPTRIYTGEYFNVLFEKLQPAIDALETDPAKLLAVLKEAEDEQNKRMAI